MSNNSTIMKKEEKRKYVKPSIKIIKVEHEGQLCAGSPTKPTPGGDLEPGQPGGGGIMTAKEFSFDNEVANDSDIKQKLNIGIFAQLLKSRRSRSEKVNNQIKIQ